jgi:hypothetical protein
MGGGGQKMAPPLMGWLFKSTWVMLNSRLTNSSTRSTQQLDYKHGNIFPEILSGKYFQIYKDAAWKFASNFKFEVLSKF